MATHRQFSPATESEIHSLLKKDRYRSEGSLGDIPPPPVLDGNYYSRWVRTETNPTTTTYPAFADAKGHRLPVKLLKHTYDDSLSDPVTLTTVEDGRSWYIYSPNGWIPRYIDLLVSVHFGLWIPTYVPELEVTLSGAITSGSSGSAAVVKHGTANGQSFTVWFDHMDSGTALSGAEARVALMPGDKKWRIIELQCTS